MASPAVIVYLHLLNWRGNQIKGSLALALKVGKSNWLLEHNVLYARIFLF